MDDCMLSIIMSHHNPYLLKHPRFVKNVQSKAQAAPSQTHLASNPLARLQRQHNTQKRGQAAYQRTRSQQRIDSRSRRSSIDSVEGKRWRRKNELTQKEDVLRQQYSALLTQLANKDLRIAELENQLSQSAKDVVELNNQLRSNQAKIEDLSLKVAGKEQRELEFNTQMQEMAREYQEQIYELRKALSRIEVEVGCANKRWTSDLQRIKVQKEAECKQLRIKCAQLITQSKSKGRLNTLFTQAESSSTPRSSQLLKINSKHDLSEELSSFELSKET